MRPRKDDMGTTRLWRNGLCNTYLLLLAVVVTGSYMILFSNSLNNNQPHDIDIAQLTADIEDTQDRIFEVKYEPVFGKYYDKYYSNTSGHLSGVKNSIDRFRNSFVRIVNRNVPEVATTDSAAQYNKLWHTADALITRSGLFRHDNDVSEIIGALASAKIVAVDVLDIGLYESGTSEKWVLSLEGGQKAVMKLMWEEKGKPKPGGLCNYGYEMPWAEIVGFHIHKLLGFMNTPYVAGRRVDIRKEILPVASPRVSKSIQLGTGSETCVIGKCHYCTKENRLCPKDGIVEASIAYWIPRHLKLHTWWPAYMPWSTPRMEGWKNVGFNNHSYCAYVREDIEPYEIDEYYYDLFDFAVIDTLMYHFDSKHYVIEDRSVANGLTIRLDHGRAFCRNDIDEENLFLAPLIQCCTLRRSTYNKLMAFKRTELFTRQLKALLRKDKLQPFLDDNWYIAFERRLKFILKIIDKCANANGGLDKMLV